MLADTFGVVVPKDHPLAKRSGKLTWSELSKFEYIGLTSDTGIGATLAAQRELGLAQIAEEDFDHASSTNSLYALLKLGGKFSVLPSLAAHTDPLSEFEFRELSEPKVEREICLITRQLRSHSPTTMRMLETLISTIKNGLQVKGVRII